MLQVAILVNKLIDEEFTFENKREYEQFIGSWKRPKKQNGKLGMYFLSLYQMKHIFSDKLLN